MRIPRCCSEIRALPAPCVVRRQDGRIELGPLFVIIAMLGIIVYASAADPSWSGLPLLAKLVIIAMLVFSVVAALLFRESSKRPDAGPDRSENVEKDAEVQPEKPGSTGH